MAKKQASKKTANKSKQHELSNTELAGIGIAITAAAAAAAGTFFLYGSKNAKKNRAKVKSWTLKAKAEALEALERAENMTREEYEQMIDRIGSAYAVVKDASKADIASFKKEMKSHWSKIAKEAKPAAKKAVKRAKKSVKKAAKKVAKKGK